MDMNAVFKLDFHTIPQEDLSDFTSLPWYQALLDDPTFTLIGNRYRRNHDPENKRRAFFAQTLWTESTIRASQCFYKGFIPTERWSGGSRPVEAQSGLGECRMLFSLGDSVSGGLKDFAHGGLTATILDEALGTPAFVQWPSGCMTAELTVKYEKPIPIPGVLLCRSWVVKTAGRKFWIKGVVEDGNGLVYARGQSLFIKSKEKL